MRVEETVKTSVGSHQACLCQFIFSHLENRKVKYNKNKMVGGSEVQSGSVEDMALEELQALIPSLTISSMPGLLTLCPSRAEVLVAKEPLHQLYTVESHPFAR